MTSSLVSLRNILFLCSFLVLAQCRQLPSWIKPCKRNDPQLDRCLINLIGSIKPRLFKGVPEMRIPVLEPFHLPLVKLDAGSEAVNFKATFKNLTAHTGAIFDLNKVKIDFDKPAVYIDVFFPQITIESLYNIDGKVLVVPIKGDGICKGRFSAVNVSLTLNGKYAHKGGKSYLQIVSKKIYFKIGDLWLNFENLFGGGKNKALGQTTNEFINQNWRDIIQELNPLLEETMGHILISVVKGFLELYAIEDLFPNS